MIYSFKVMSIELYDLQSNIPIHVLLFWLSLVMRIGPRHSCWRKLYQQKGFEFMLQLQDYYSREEMQNIIKRYKSKAHARPIQVKRWNHQMYI